MDTFIKIYIVISLWLWTGLFLSSPSLRRAFVDMHRRIIERVYKAIKKQVVKLIQKTAGFISRKLRTASHYMQESSYDLRVSVARSLVSKELLKELMHKNLVYAISRARMMDQGDSGVGLDELETMADLAVGKQVGAKGRKEAVETAFRLCDTDLFEQMIRRIPRAQERILLAFDRIEGSNPYESVKNEVYRKFIRE